MKKRNTENGVQENDVQGKIVLINRMQAYSLYRVRGRDIDEEQRSYIKKENKKVHFGLNNIFQIQIKYRATNISIRHPSFRNYR